MSENICMLISVHTLQMRVPNEKKLTQEKLSEVQSGGAAQELSN